MTAKELAESFYEGFKTALTCPEVSPSEYRGVMEYRIQEALDAEREACAELAGLYDYGENAARAIRARK